MFQSNNALNLSFRILHTVGLPTKDEYSELGNLEWITFNPNYFLAQTSFLHLVSFAAVNFLFFAKSFIKDLRNGVFPTGNRQKSSWEKSPNIWH